MFYKIARCSLATIQGISIPVTIYSLVIQIILLRNGQVNALFMINTSYKEIQNGANSSITISQVSKKINFQNSFSGIKLLSIKAL